MDFLNRIEELINIGDKGYHLYKTSNSFSENYTQFRSGSLSLIKTIYGNEHPYYIEFDNKTKQGFGYLIPYGRGILLAIKNEIEDGWLFTVKGLVSAEIFSDFLEMAKHLLDEKYKDPAAVMIGSVLEEHLRQLCNKHSIDTTFLNQKSEVKPKKADMLNADLAKHSIYNLLEQKNVTAWLDLRNKAAHGLYLEYDHNQVDLMYQGVLDFMVRNAI